MASTRKTRKVNKRFAKVNDDWPDKEGPSASTKAKNKKRKLVDMLGPQWSKEELERFYDSYRKYGKDWRKVGGAVRNRTSDMVEALYNMNRAYLSLPEGAATAVGLIAMMTDHYSNHDGSNSDNEIPDSPKPITTTTTSTIKQLPKRNKGKAKVEPKPPSKPRYPDLLQYEPASSSFSALSALKKKRTGVTRPRAVGKRTPRIPIGSMLNRNYDKFGSTSKKPEEDEGAHVAAMALAEVFHRGGSPPDKSERESSKAVQKEDSSGSQEAENEESPAKLAGKKQKRSQRRKSKGGVIIGASKNKSGNDDKEACSGTEEVNNVSSGKRIIDNDSESKSSSARKKNRQLFFRDEDESNALDALHTLADLSVNILLPTLAESESSAQEKEDEKKESKRKTPVKKDKRKMDSDAGPGKKTKISETKDNSNNASKQDKGKRVKPTPTKKSKDDDSKTDLQKGDADKLEITSVETKGTPSKNRRGSNASPGPKQIRLVISSPSITGPSAPRPSTFIPSTSTAQIPTKNKLASELPTKRTHPRKSSIVKSYSERLRVTESDKRPVSSPLKDKMSHSFFSSLFRRWCKCEWFYSAIDYPWFAQSEFVEYLNHVQLGHVPRLTRVEWGVIRSSLGKPRRLSEQFLKEEREKLQKYRESVREHYFDLREGKREGLPLDLARPLAVGQRVIACHPKSRELHDGNILSVYHDSCRVQFDRADLAVEFVKDVDCMPLNPLENMPEFLKRQNGVHSMKFSDFPRFAMRPPNSNNSSRSLDVPPITALSKQAKGDSIDSVAQAKASVNEAVGAVQQAMYSQPCTLSQIQEREADIRALAELSRALDKKEALLMELRHMNEDVSVKHKEGDTISDIEHFRRQYAMVLVQLRDANDQVASALLALRQRNTYTNPPNPWNRSVVDLAPSEMFDNSGMNNSQDSETPQVVEIMESSRRKAKMMVDTAVQAMCTTNEGEDQLVKIGDALDSLSNRNSGSGSSILGIRRIPPDSGHTNSSFQENNISATSPLPGAQSPKMRLGGEIRLPSELISSCVSTLLMIQSCTERQHPPAEVAHILDAALASMQPSCPENQGVFREIETCMGIIKNQMLALIPTPLSSDFHLL